MIYTVVLSIYSVLNTNYLSFMTSTLKIYERQNYTLPLLNYFNVEDVAEQVIMYHIVYLWVFSNSLGGIWNKGLKNVIFINTWPLNFSIHILLQNLWIIYLPIHNRNHLLIKFNLSISTLIVPPAFILLPFTSEAISYISPKMTYRWLFSAILQNQSIITSVNGQTVYSWKKVLFFNSKSN